MSISRIPAPRTRDALLSKGWHILRRIAVTLGIILNILIAGPGLVVGILAGYAEPAVMMVVFSVIGWGILIGIASLIRRVLLRRFDAAELERRGEPADFTY